MNNEKEHNELEWILIDEIDSSRLTKEEKDFHRLVSIIQGYSFLLHCLLIESRRE